MRRLSFQIEEAERNYDLEALARLKHGKLPELESSISKDNQLQKKIPGRMLRKRLLRMKLRKSYLSGLVSL